ncbi:hypothetical protein IFM51744_01229 [Aspergillus udagawae]|nr:hypothetical protein IFM51744_01229 [Aspergillus udagawae]
MEGDWSSLDARQEKRHVAGAYWQMHVVRAKRRLITTMCVLIDTWLAELRARPGDAFSILLFQGSSLHTSDYLRKSLTVDTLTDLETRLQALDPANVSMIRNYENDLAIEQLAEIQAAQTIDDENTSEQGDFGSGRKARSLSSMIGSSQRRQDAYTLSWSDIIALLEDIISPPGTLGVPAENAANLVLIYQDFTHLRHYLVDGRELHRKPPAQTPLEGLIVGILALIDQPKRRIHKANTIALFAAFGLPHNANVTHLAALNLISLESFYDGLVVREDALPDRHFLNAGFLADLQRVWDASLTLLEAEGSVAPAN